MTQCPCAVGQELECNGVLQHADTECWVLQDSPLSWSQAVSQCHSLSGQLAEVSDFSSHSLLKDMMVNASVASLWLGSKETVYPDWRWLNGQGESLVWCTLT